MGTQIQDNRLPPNLKQRMPMDSRNPMQQLLESQSQSLSDFKLKSSYSNNFTQNQQQINKNAQKSSSLLKSGLLKFNKTNYQQQFKTLSLPRNLFSQPMLSQKHSDLNTNQQIQQQQLQQTTQIQSKFLSSEKSSLQQESLQLPSQIQPLSGGESKIILQNRFTRDIQLPRLEDTQKAFIKGGLFSPKILNRDREQIFAEFDTRRMSHEQNAKVVDDFLNPKYYQVPKDLKTKYKLNLHERFNMFEDNEKDKKNAKYPYDNLYQMEKQKQTNSHLQFKDGEVVVKPQKKKKPQKPKEYLEISIHGGQIDEQIRFSRYQSSEESDVVQEFRDRQDVHESSFEQNNFLNLVDRYKPKNYRKASSPSHDSSHDSELFKGENPIENEMIQLDDQDFAVVHKELNQETQQASQKALINHSSPNSQFEKSQFFKSPLSQPSQQLNNDQTMQQESTDHLKTMKIPFKSLVIKQKRDKILKFLMRQDSFSKELQQIEDFKLKNALKGGKKPNVIEEREQQERIIQKRIKEMERKCYNEMVDKYSLIRQMQQKKQFKEDLLGRKFNFHLSFLSLDANAQKRIREAFIKKKKLFNL
eukprot:403354699